MFKNFEYGQKVVLDIDNGDILYGVFVKGTEKRIDLKDIVNREGQQLSGILSFYESQVNSIHLLIQCHSENPSLLPHINIPCADFERLRELSLKYKFIAQKDSRYFEAYKRIVNSETVAVVGFPLDFQRNSHLSVLALGTPKDIFIFDISTCAFKDFYEELREILESNDILKVVHDGRALLDYLKHNHHVRMSNVFDTQVASFILDRCKSNVHILKWKTLTEMLTSYFNFPENFLKREVCKDWHERPLLDKQKLFASQSAAYLLKLKDHLQANLLIDYHKTLNSEYAMPFSMLDSFKIDMNLSET